MDRHTGSDFNARRAGRLGGDDGHFVAQRYEPARQQLDHPLGTANEIGLIERAAQEDLHTGGSPTLSADLSIRRLLDLSRSEPIGSDGNSVGERRYTSPVGGPPELAGIEDDLRYIE